MEGLTLSLFWLLAIGLGLMAIVQGLSRRVDLFSIRNVYLAGFVVYQIVSPVSAFRTGRLAGFRIADPERALNWLMIYCYVFIAVYLFAYHRLQIAQWLAGKFSGGTATASDSMLTGLAISLIVAALASRAIGIQVPLLRGFSINVAVAFTATACAITGWVWGAPRLNPAVLTVVAFVLSVSMVVSLTGFFSRRPLVSILAGFAWGAYHRWARHLSPARLIVATIPLILVAGAVIAAYTAVRGHSSNVVDAQTTLRRMTAANLSYGSGDLLSGQAVGSVALWIMEAYPQEIEYNHLFSLRYMAYYFVPRLLWQDKPEPLSTQVANLAKLRGVNRDVITLPPGVVGYAGAEGGFYAVVIYGLFFGQFTRFFDELIRRHPTNPFIILPVGCSTGQFLGLARGDIATFTNLALIGFFAAFLLIYLTSLAFGRSQSAPLATPWPQMR